MKFLVEVEGCFKENHVVFNSISKQLERVYFAPTKTFIILNVNNEKEYRSVINHIINRINHDDKLSLISVYPIYEKHVKNKEIDLKVHQSPEFIEFRKIVVEVLCDECKAKLEERLKEIETEE